MIATRTEFVVVGGYAMAQALRRFGSASLGLRAADFAREGVVVQLGSPPQRIDILTRVDGLTWEEASCNPSFAEVGGLRVPFISRAALVRNKRASGRLRDLADVEALEALKALEGRAGRA